MLFVARPPTLQRIHHQQRMDRQRAARAWLALDAAKARQSPLGPNADPASASVAAATASAAAKPWGLHAVADELHESLCLRPNAHPRGIKVTSQVSIDPAVLGN